MDSALMPLADEAPPCSLFTHSIEVRPAGTGLGLDRVFVVSVPEPWPKPALGHAWLKPASVAVAKSSVRSRLFAAVPWSDQLTIELYERDGSSRAFRRFEWTFTEPAQVEPIIASVTGVAVGAIELASSPVVDPLLLLCTQGSHDACCGRFGNEFADLLASERPDIGLRRVSHTGGHRFAPTMLALPSGRMWAWADLDLVDRIATGQETAQDLTDKCRGWLGTTRGPAQVAEIAALVDGLHELTTASADATANGAIEVSALEDAAGPTDPHDGRTRWVVRSGQRSIEVTVRPRRSIPTIACESPGGLPAKPTTDYEWQIGDQPWT